jgi:hypothetical protein
MLNALSIATTIATIVIAFAAVETWLVYRRMSQQIDKQIELTRDLFLKSHKPALSISIEGCAYSQSTQRFSGTIAIMNHGTAIAHQVSLTADFAVSGCNSSVQTGTLAIQAQSTIKQPFSFSMNATSYEVGTTEGNRLGAMVYGSYRGISDRQYQYRERQEYHLAMAGFVPIWATDTNDSSEL